MTDGYHNFTQRNAARFAEIRELEAEATQRQQPQHQRDIEAELKQWCEREIAAALNNLIKKLLKEMPEAFALEREDMRVFITGKCNKLRSEIAALRNTVESNRLSELRAEIDTLRSITKATANNDLADRTNKLERQLDQECDKNLSLRNRIEVLGILTRSQNVGQSLVKKGVR